uniref:Uncharacterized protein n=1 Tax=Panagrolaimus davidi TaxID=227884 RepID=A0A914Q6P8_9BILA
MSKKNRQGKDAARLLKIRPKPIISSASPSSSIGQSSKLLYRKKKYVTFDSADHIKIIPNRHEIQQDQENWSPNGKNRTKRSICSDDIQNSNIPHHQQKKQKQPASNNNYAPFSPFSYTPIFQTNGQPQNLYSNRLFSLPNYRSTSTFPRSNVINDDKRPSYGFSTNNDDLPILPLRPPIRRHNLNDYMDRRSNVMNNIGSDGQASNSNKRRANDNDNNEFETPKNKKPKLEGAGQKDATAQGKNVIQENNQSKGAKNGSNNDDLPILPLRTPIRQHNLNDYGSTFSRKNFNQKHSSNRFSDLSKLPRRPPLRKQSSKSYYERFPRINLKDRKSLKPAQSCLDSLWKMFWGPKRRTKQFESC